MAHFLLNAEGVVDRGDEPFSGIKGEDFDRVGGLYLNSRKFFDGPRTIQRRLTSMRAYGKYAKLGLVMSDYVAPTAPPARPHPLPQGMAGVLEMIEFARNEYEQATVALCGMAGARIGEALSVTVEDVNFKDRVIRLGGKHQRWREVPMSKMFSTLIAPAVVQARVRGEVRLVPRSDSWGRDLIKDLAKFAGLDEATASHYLRATFATWLYGKTKDLRLVQEALGHARSATTEIYTAINFNALRAAVELDEGTL